MFLDRQVVCPACGSASALRINRAGFLQQKVLGVFGIYPWKCGACGSRFFCRRRSLRSSAPPPMPRPNYGSKRMRRRQNP